jgi:hypothetical protein
LTAKEPFLNGRLQKNAGRGFAQDPMVLLYAIFVLYALTGVVLTKRICGPVVGARTNDCAVGALFMPVVACMSLLCRVLRIFWSGLLALLDFQRDD